MSTFLISNSAAVLLFETRETIDIKEPPFKTITSTLSYSSSTPKTASKSALTFSAAVLVIVARAQIDTEKASRNTLSPSASSPDDLSSIYVQSKSPPDITDYIITRANIEQIFYINAICSSNGYKELVQMARYLDITFHTYFMGTADK